MKAIKATLTTSQPVISEDEFNIMFYKIPDLHALHKNFLDGLKRRTQNWDGRLTIGDHFRIMVSSLQQAHRQSVMSTHSISPCSLLLWYMLVFHIQWKSIVMRKNNSLKIHIVRHGFSSYCKQCRICKCVNCSKNQTADISCWFVESRALLKEFNFIWYISTHEFYSEIWNWFMNDGVLQI
jgi:RhoGEF domain.